MSEHPSSVSPRTPAAAQPSSTYRPTPDEAELIRLSQEWMHVALVKKDEQRLRRLMAPEFTLQIWDASRAAQDLDTWMHTLLRRLAAVELKYTSLSARVFGDMASCTARSGGRARWMGIHSSTLASWPTSGRAGPVLGRWLRDAVRHSSKSRHCPSHYYARVICRRRNPAERLRLDS